MDEGCSRVMGDRAKRMEGRKRDQPSQTSSSREKRQINSRRIELPIIIGPQQPEAVLDQRERRLHQRTIKEVLVQWKDMTPADATWEPATILQQFPHLKP
jgi:hypothetical protein